MSVNKQNEFALVNGRVILPMRAFSDLAVVVRDGRIAGMAAVDSLGVGLRRIDVGGRFVAPGLVDIHTHGAMGRSFNEVDAGAWEAVAEANAEKGVTALLATLATAPLEDLLACLEFSENWMEGKHPGAQILGVHLEGPYFHPQHKGAQDPANLRTPDDGSVDALLAHAGALKVVTYAPELPGALELTARLVDLGIVPAAGHSAATEREVYAAMERGLRHTVHAWSGQSSTIRHGPWRVPGLLEATLVSPGLTAEIIADNRHLPPTLMKLAYQCKGADKLCAVSDATNGAGLPDGASFRMGEMEYRVEDGVGMMLDHTAFAGSTTLLGQMLSVLVNEVGIPLAEAVRMCSLTPARVVGVSERKGSLMVGKDADVIVLEDDLSVWRTMIAGEWVFPPGQP